MNTTKLNAKSSCNDISNTIGITATPVIDPNTDIMYFWAKAYMATGQRGYQNGAYRFHAVNIPTLVERPGYPVNLNGRPGILFAKAQII
jgi:hypothetical protein